MSCLSISLNLLLFRHPFFYFPWRKQLSNHHAPLCQFVDLLLQSYKVQWRVDLQNQFRTHLLFSVLFVLSSLFLVPSWWWTILDIYFLLSNFMRYRDRGSYYFECVSVFKLCVKMHHIGKHRTSSNNIRYDPSKLKKCSLLICITFLLIIKYVGTSIN